VQNKSAVAMKNLNAYQLNRILVQVKFSSPNHFLHKITKDFAIQFACIGQYPSRKFDESGNAGVCPLLFFLPNFERGRIGVCRENLCLRSKALIN
jgi:hypothetical protein